MLVSEIADLLDYEVAGTDCDIRGIAWPDEAEETDLAVIRKKTDLFHTRAKAILTTPMIATTDKTLLFTFEKIECAMVNVCKILIKNKLLKDFSLPTNYLLDAHGYYIGENCKIRKKACIQPGAIIGDNVTIGDNCMIEPFAVIGSGTILERNVHIGNGSKIGVSSFYHYYVEGKINHFCGCGIVKIGENTHIGCNTIIQRGTISNTVISANCMIGNCIDIGHDVKIGKNCKIVSQTGIAGNTSIKNNVLIYGQVGISNNIVIGDNVIIMGKSAVTKSINDNDIVYGAFGRNYSQEMKLIAKVKRFFERKDE